MEYIYSNKPTDFAADSISSEIVDRLSIGESILLLLSGGSAVELAVNISKKINSKNLSKLYITLVDERYDKLNHVDENWRQLIDSGFITSNSNVYRPLIDRDVVSTVKSYDAWLTKRMNNCDYKIGIFGIGSDGHTAGIKPYSKAVSSRKNVEFYKSNDYRRITITPTLIEKVDKAVVYAVGENKRKILNNFINKDETIDNMPAQILKRVPKLIIYTNIKREDLI